MAAYIRSLETVGGLYKGTAMNPARALGPDIVAGRTTAAWVYVLGPLLGAACVVGVELILRGPADLAEAEAAERESAPSRSAEPYLNTKLVWRDSEKASTHCGS